MNLNEEINSIKKEEAYKDIKIEKNTSIKNKFELNYKPKKRIRDYSPTMDIEEDFPQKDKINHNNKKKLKIPLRQLLKKITLEDSEDKKKKSSTKNKRGIKIFSDMSVSEISNNLFKNYYPCLLPPYYTEQISEQIVDSQIKGLVSNYIQKKEENKNIKSINPKINYLRKMAQEIGEWVDKEEDEYNKEIRNEDEDEDYDKSDSNNENNSNNTYPEDESIEEEDNNENTNFNDYDYYDNKEDYD